jgi:hypothetical protein
MVASLVRRRRLVLAALVLSACAAGLLALAAYRHVPAVTAAPQAAAPTTDACLVVRHESGHDTLWLISPVDGTATAAGELPGAAGAAAVSPEGSVAYLPENGAPQIWVGWGPLSPLRTSLAAAGVRRIDALTWVDNDRLLVSGVKSGRADPYRDRLFLVDVTTGKTRAFRNLSGAEPSGAPAVGKAAYVRFKLVSAATRRKPAVYRESLKVLSVSSGGAGRTVWTDQYSLPADHRALSRPQIAPRADWFLTGETGSDVRVTYAVRDAEYGMPLLTVYTPAVQAGGGWDAAGKRTAFAGALLDSGDGGACVWVYDVASGNLTRSPAGLLPEQMIGDVAWSPSGLLALGGFIASGTPAARHVYILSADDLSAVKTVAAGELPVWVQR